MTKTTFQSDCLTEVYRSRSDLCDNESLPIAHAGHEFLIVLVVFTALGKVRLLLSRYFDNEWMSRFIPKSWTYPAKEIAHGAAIAAMTKGAGDEFIPLLQDDLFSKHAKRINFWARGRRSSDPFDRFHAESRAALSLTGLMGTAQEQEFCRDAERQLTGVPNSEPTWTRLLDGTLSAIALKRLGAHHCVKRWSHTLETRFALHGGRRAAALHTPTMMSLGTARPWEHATATALAFNEGWIDDRDWHALRGQCMGAAAGGAKDPALLRLIAAGQLWASMAHDEEAAKVLARRKLSSDRLASMIHGLAICESR